MKRLLFFLFLIPFGGISQLNMTYLGYYDIPDSHGVELNDIWGYTDEFGNEYALVGTTDGVSVMDVTTPSSPVEVAWIPGLNSVWRDIKTYNDYAYVTTEASEGLLIIDLTPLPASTTLPTAHYTGPLGNEWYTAHNLYQDNGYVYIFGAGRGNGGVIILDVATDPMNPIEAGTFDTWYAHDGYVRNDTGFFAHINDGFFSIVDLTNIAAPVWISDFTTPSNFTHNIWVTADGDYAFTTDEVTSGYIGAYDISNASTIKYMDQIQCDAGTNVIPHNTHVLGDYIYTSYYTYGVVIHDISRPHNMIEVARFDTSPLSTPNYSGCWGVYPFLPSGNIIASDMEEGLFILDASEHPGAYLEGTVKEFGTLNPLSNVKITIDGQNITDYSGTLGNYATGIEASGTYDVTYFKILYYPQTISTTVSQGVVTTQNVELVPIPQYQLTVTVLDATTLMPVENAMVTASHPYISSTAVTDLNGEAVIGLYYEDNYELLAGKWGYDVDCFTDTLITSSGPSNITMYIDEGIYDDFSFDFGWSVFGNVEKGMWVRDVPVGVNAGGTIENPFTDGLWDCGREAYVTGNGSTAGNDQEVENGQTVLISPVFDLTGYSNPHVNFEAFFYNDIGPFYPNDTMFVSLFNGSETVDIVKIYKDNTNMGLWYPYSIPVGGLLNMTNTMQLVISISDYTATVNICEAAFDHFSITDFSMLSMDDEVAGKITTYPNPASNELFIQGTVEGEAFFYDLSGRLVAQFVHKGSVNVSSLDRGLYILALKDLNGNIVSLSRQMIE